MDRILISAAHKSSGKTTVSIGLCAALQHRGLEVQPFKKGPDYIDPLWLGAASARPCYNLDFNTQSDADIRTLFSTRAVGSDLCLVEANKGLYDGVARDGSDSNAALAKLLALPVVLVIDVRGMTRGIAPLLLGYQQFDAAVRIGGVILNRTGGARHEGKLRQAVEYHTDLSVLGAVQDSPVLAIDERHLGLMPSNEHRDAERQIVRIRELIAAQVDVGAVLQLARTADGTQQAAGSRIPQGSARLRAVNNGSDVHIGICRDPAFGFYYPDDLDALQQAGATLININTLRDTGLPFFDGLFIGGGFPETRLHELAANQALRTAIRSAIENGLPTYAECGGLMYLARSLSWKGERAEMAGVIPGDAVMYPRPQGRGYVELEPTSELPWPGAGVGLIRAHEFHYSRLENLAPGGRFAFRVRRGSGIDGEHDGWVCRNLLASYTHLRSTSRFDWASRFVNFVRNYKRKTML